LAKKKKEKTYRAPTKRQLSHWEKEKKRQRIIFISGIAIIALVVLALLGSWLYFQVIPMNRVVIQVNDRDFKMSHLIDMLVYYSNSNVQYQIDQVLAAIEQTELIRQDSARLGVTVTDAEVNAALNKQNPPISKKYWDIVKAQLLSQKMYNEYFDKQVPTSAPQRHIMAMLLESESQAQDIKNKLDNGEGFDTLAEQYSLNDYIKKNKGDLGWHPENVLNQMFGSTKLEQYAFSADAGQLSDPIYDDTQSKSVGYWLLKVTERKEDTKEAHVMAMLLGGEEEALAAKKRLDAGEDFAAVAKELSQDTDSKEAGGDIGFIPQEGSGKSQAFTDFVFNEEVPIGTVSDPIKDITVTTKGAYWLIKVAEIDGNRPLDDNNRSILKSQLMTDWSNSLMTDPNYKVTVTLSDEQRAFAVEQAQKILNKTKSKQG
jgi:parvulin-like peptidyl-prolyl isomerase